jgi:Phosphotransferase enzyme family
MDPSLEDVQRARRALGVAPVAWRDASGHAAPSNRRSIVTLPDGSTAFLKIAAFDYTADWLRAERRAYELLDGEPFLPRALGWDDDGVAPVLALEDLSHGRWPPPWDAASVNAVLASLDALHAVRPGDALPGAEESQFGVTDGWARIAANPGPFLNLGLCSPSWLDRCFATLDAAASSARIEGDSLLHFDVRSDNVALIDGRALLVDWNGACSGNPLLDTASWLPSLAAEGGPSPEAILPDDTPGIGEMASLLAGFFGSRAGLSPIPQAPHARPLQLMQARTALPWAARLLGLPPLS